MSRASGPGHVSSHVHQATGMISVQAECTIDDALLLLVDRAYELRQPVDSVARDVINRVIQFGP